MSPYSFSLRAVNQLRANWTIAIRNGYRQMGKSRQTATTALWSLLLHINQLEILTDASFGEYPLHWDGNF